jgi:hypothetical protein
MSHFLNWVFVSGACVGLDSHGYEAAQVIVNVKAKFVAVFVAWMYVGVLSTILLEFSLDCEPAIALTWGVTMGVYLVWDLVVLPLHIFVMHVLLPRYIRDELRHVDIGHEWKEKLVAKAPPPLPLAKKAPSSLARKQRSDDVPTKQKFIIAKTTRGAPVPVDVQPRDVPLSEETRDGKLFQFDAEFEKVLGLSDVEQNFFQWYVRKIKGSRCVAAPLKKPGEDHATVIKRAEPSFSLSLTMTVLLNRLLARHFLVTSPFYEPHRDGLELLIHLVETGRRRVGKMRHDWVRGRVGTFLTTLRATLREWSKSTSTKRKSTGNRRRVSVFVLTAAATRASAKVVPARSVMDKGKQKRHETTTASAVAGGTDAHALVTSSET